MVPKGGEAYREAHAVATASHHGRGNSEEFEMGVVEPVQRGGKATENGICVCVCVCRPSADEYFFGGMGMEGERKGDRGLVAFCLRILNIRC